VICVSVPGFFMNCCSIGGSDDGKIVSAYSRDNPCLGGGEFQGVVDGGSGSPQQAFMWRFLLEGGVGPVPQPMRTIDVACYHFGCKLKVGGTT